MIDDDDRTIELITPETLKRKLGNCVKRNCNKELIEYISECGIWCYNYQLTDEHRIVYLMQHGRYCCRSCASQRERKKHDKTF